MRIFTLLVLLLMVNTAFSMTKIKGMLSSGYRSPLIVSLNEKDAFFAKHYDLELMDIGNLECLNSCNRYQEIDFKSYDALVSGALDLISYDESTGIYKYRFSIKSNIIFMENPPHQGRLRLNANVHFSNNNKRELIMQGKLLHHNNDKPILTNIDNRDNDGAVFHLDEDISRTLALNKGNNSVALYTNIVIFKTQHAIPVIIELYD